MAILHSAFHDAFLLMVSISMLLGIIEAVWLMVLHLGEHSGVVVTASEYDTNSTNSTDSTNSTSSPCQEYGLPTDTVFFTSDSATFGRLHESDCALGICEHVFGKWVTKKQTLFGKSEKKHTGTCATPTAILLIMFTLVFHCILMGGSGIIGRLTRGNLTLTLTLTSWLTKGVKMGAVLLLLSLSLTIWFVTDLLTGSSCSHQITPYVYQCPSRFGWMIPLSNLGFAVEFFAVVGIILYMGKLRVLGGFAVSITVALQLTLVTMALINLGGDVNVGSLLLQGESGGEVGGPLDDRGDLLNLLKVRYWISIAIFGLGCVLMVKTLF